MVAFINLVSEFPRQVCRRVSQKDNIRQIDNVNTSNQMSFETTFFQRKNTGNVYSNFESLLFQKQVCRIMKTF